MRLRIQSGRTIVGGLVLLGLSWTGGCNGSGRGGGAEGGTAGTNEAPTGGVPPVGSSPGGSFSGDASGGGAPAGGVSDVSVGGGAAGAGNEDAATASGGSEPGVDAGIRGGRWTSLGYDSANTQVNPNETILSVDNVAGLKEQWRVQFPSGATSTPAVYDGTVYFGGWDGNAYAADAVTGEIRWQTHVTRLLVRSTPLVTEDRVFVAAGSNLVALNREQGKVVFEVALSAHPETLIDSSPELAGDLVIIGVSFVENTFPKEDYTATGAVVAIDASSGEEVWRVPTSGEDAGRCAGGAGVSVWSSAAIDDDLGLAYIGTGQNFEQPPSPCSDSLIAIHFARDYEGDRIAWTAQYTQGDVFSNVSFLGQDADIGASPNLFDAAGRPAVGAGDKAGSYRVFDRTNGELIWRRDLAIGAWVQGGGVMTTAAVYDGTVYVASIHRESIGELLGEVGPNDGATLYALDASTGEPRWSLETEIIAGSLAIANGVLYHPSSTGSLFARRLDSGDVLWSTNVGSKIGAGPSIVDGRLYASAGFESGFSTATPVEKGFVASFGLGSGPRTVWEAEVEELEPLTVAECEARVESASDWPNASGPSAACASCLCQCDPTAAGHCDSCFLQAPCTARSCGIAPDIHLCMGLLCTTKLLPSYVFERSIQVAPCVIECAATCGF